MIGSEEEVLGAVSPCLEECHKAGVYTQLQVSSQHLTIYLKASSQHLENFTKTFLSS